MPRKREVNRDYTTVSVPLSLIRRIQKYLERPDAIYKSNVDFVLSSIRKELDNLGLLEPRKKNVLEHFNLNMEGVRILDQSINLVVDIAFRPEGIWCHYCEAENCRHIQFALSVPEIQDVIRRKKKDGWKLPEI